jgi:HEAT repeat protein
MTELAVALQENWPAARWQALAKFNQTGNGKSSDPNTLSALTQALADEHAFVRWQAGLALATQADGRRKLTELLQSYTSPSFATESEQSKLARMCASAIDALAERKSTETKNYLLNSLVAPEPELRQSAAEALARQGDKAALPHLLAALKDDHLWVRRAAALGLGHLGDVSAAPALIACLRDEAVFVRRSAAYALGALRAEAAVAPLRISLTDRDPQVRRNAAWALGRMAHIEAVDDLNRLLADPDDMVATSAQEAIAAISKPIWQRFFARRSR